MSFQGKIIKLIKIKLNPFFHDNQIQKSNFKSVMHTCGVWLEISIIKIRNIYFCSNKYRSLIFIFLYKLTLNFKKKRKYYNNLKIKID